MARLPFSHYRDAYMSRMQDMGLHRDFMKVLDWLEGRPGEDVGMSEIATVIADGGVPGPDELGRAIGVAAVMTSWPQPVATAFLVVRDASGELHEVGSVEQAVVSGRKRFVLEATGEVIDDFPSRAYPRFRVADFEPGPARPGM